MKVKFDQRREGRRFCDGGENERYGPAGDAKLGRRDVDE